MMLVLSSADGSVVAEVEVAAPAAAVLLPPHRLPPVELLPPPIVEAVVGDFVEKAFATVTADVAAAQRERATALVLA